MQELQELPIPLLEWFRDNARKLPWREEPTPYHVWLSEIMLQQTRVAAVLEYYQRFLAECPDVAALAALLDERLMKLWQGLGYYSRARNLKKAAQLILEQHGGVFPSQYEAVRALPGVGDYTAGAICSIAFGQAVPAVDGNVLRVISRILAYEGDITVPQSRATVTQWVADSIPLQAPGTYNQALMELGALVCLPNGAPLCQRCPAQALCRAHLGGNESAFPVKAPRGERRKEQRTVWLILREGRIALHKRPGKGLLAGLWEFPNDCSPAPPLPNLTDIRPQGSAKHVFTHVEWHMKIVSASAAAAAAEELPPDWVWAEGWELDAVYAVPSAFRRALELAKELLRRDAT